MKHRYIAPRINILASVTFSVIALIAFMRTSYDGTSSTVRLTGISLLLIGAVYVISGKYVTPVSDSYLSRLKGKHHAKKYKYSLLFWSVLVVIFGSLLIFCADPFFYSLQSSAYGKNALFFVSSSNRLYEFFLLLTLPLFLIGLCRVVVYRFGSSKYCDYLATRQLRRERKLRIRHYDYHSEALHFLRFGMLSFLACFPVLLIGFTNYSAVYPAKAIQRNLLSEHELAIDKNTSLVVTTNTYVSCHTNRINSCSKAIEVQANLSDDMGRNIELGTRQLPPHSDYQALYKFSDVQKLVREKNGTVALIPPKFKVFSGADNSALIPMYYEQK